MQVFQGRRKSNNFGIPLPSWIALFMPHIFLTPQLSWESLKSRLLKIKLHQYQHMTCPDMSKKHQKVPNFRAKKTYLPACFFLFFHAMYSSCPKEFKNAIKMKSAIFLSGSSSDMPYIRETQKIDVTTHDKCRKKIYDIWQTS